MEDEPVTSIAQRFAVRGNDRHTCALMRPAVRGSHACFLIQNNQWLRRPRDSRAIFRRSADLGLPGKNLYRRLSERVYGCDCGVAPGVTSADCFNSNEMKIATTLTWPRWSRFRIPAASIPPLRGRNRRRYYGMNSPHPSAERHRSSRVPKNALAVMLVIIGALALLAIFANVQRFRRGHVETVAVRLAASPTPQAR